MNFFLIQQYIEHMRPIQGDFSWLDSKSHHLLIRQKSQKIQITKHSKNTLMNNYQKCGFVKKKLKGQQQLVLPYYISRNSKHIFEECALYVIQIPQSNKGIVKSKRDINYSTMIPLSIQTKLLGKYSQQLQKSFDILSFYIILFYFLMILNDQDPFIILRSFRSTLDLENIRSLTENQAHSSHSSAWTPEEHFRYINFLKENTDILSTTELRKHYQVFRMMQRVIQTRTSRQIKSHHQKLFLKYKNLQTIIQKTEDYIRCLMASEKRQGNENDPINSSSQLNRPQDLSDIISVQQIRQISLDELRKSYNFQSEGNYQIYQYNYHEQLHQDQFFK